VISLVTATVMRAGLGGLAGAVTAAGLAASGLNVDVRVVGAVLAGMGSAQFIALDVLVFAIDKLFDGFDGDCNQP
jgi:hypothetical protein